MRSRVRLHGKEPALIKRRRFKQTKSLKERLLEQAEKLREEAILLPSVADREAALKKARQIEAAAHMDDWLNSPGLQPPKNVEPARPISDGFAEQAKRFRDKAAEAEALIDMAQTEQRRDALRHIVDNYNRTADQLEGINPPPRKPR